jgi:NADH-quinone oxidoreductase subunit E
VGAGEPSILGLRLAHRRGWTAPGSADAVGDEHTAEETAPAGGAASAPGPADVPVDSARRTGSADSPSNEPDELPASASPTAADGTEKKGGTA